MWKWLLLTASLAHAQFESMECSNVATAQTKSVAGPSGLSAFVKVSSEDDHNKELHTCMAEYKLLLKSGEEDAPNVVNLTSNDADWGRQESSDPTFRRPLRYDIRLRRNHQLRRNCPEAGYSQQMRK